MTRVTEAASTYEFVGVSEEWKQACSGLPCFEALQWPGYRTKVIDTRIRGKDVTIQLWKGTCQKFLGVDSMPGGIGAEIGVYRKTHGKERPRDRIPALFETVYDALPIGKKSPVWLPYTDLGVELTFKLSFRGQTFFTAGPEPETSYWLTKWMQPESYERWCRVAGQKVPSHPEKFQMTCTVDGKKFDWLV